MNGTRKRTTTRKGDQVEHLAMFRSDIPLTLTGVRYVLDSLEKELQSEGLDTEVAEVRVSGKGVRMTGASVTGIALVVTEKAGKA